MKWKLTHYKWICTQHRQNRHVYKEQTLSRVYGQKNLRRRGLNSQPCAPLHSDSSIMHSSGWSSALVKLLSGGSTVLGVSILHGRGSNPASQGYSHPNNTGPLLGLQHVATVLVLNSNSLCHPYIWNALTISYTNVKATKTENENCRNVQWWKSDTTQRTFKAIENGLKVPEEINHFIPWSSGERLWTESNRRDLILTVFLVVGTFSSECLTLFFATMPLH